MKSLLRIQQNVHFVEAVKDVLMNEDYCLLVVFLLGNCGGG